MHLRSASMPSQQQQAGVLESIEPPCASPIGIRQYRQKLWLNHGRIHSNPGKEMVGLAALGRRVPLRIARRKAPPTAHLAASRLAKLIAGGLRFSVKNKVGARIPTRYN